MKSSSDGSAKSCCRQSPQIHFHSQSQRYPLLADSRRRFSYRQPFRTITFRQYHHNYFYSFPTSIITMKSTSFLALLVTSLVASVFGFVPKTFSARSKGSTLSMSASERTYIMVRRRTNYPGINTQNKPGHSQYTYAVFHLSLTNYSYHYHNCRSSLMEFNEELSVTLFLDSKPRDTNWSRWKPSKPPANCWKNTTKTW